MTVVVERKARRKLISAPTCSPAGARLPDMPRSRLAGHVAVDARAAGATLEPLVCANIACPDPLSGNVAFDQGAGDTYCAICGEWQNDLPDELEGAA